jgi:hypothetical protein
MAHGFKQRSTILALLGLSIMFLLAGCAANYASFRLDDQIAQAFKNYQMIDGYRYYYSGRENKPSAIVGINPEFQFSSKFWTSIEPSKFKEMVDRMFPTANALLYGAAMLAPDGRKAGVYYSWVEFRSAKFVGQRVIVYSPEEFAEPDGPDIPTRP